MICNKGCNKPTSCSCECEEDEMNRCNDCINQESIDFNIDCDPERFTVGVNTWTELTAVGTVLVPEEKPPIEELDKIDAKVEIIRRKIITTPSGEDNYEGKKITGKKIIIEGLLCLRISYVSLKLNQSVHSFHGEIPFSAFVVVPNTYCEELDTLVQGCIEEICVKRVCERSVDLSTSVFLRVVPIEGNDCSYQEMDESGIECASTVGFTKCSQRECFTDNPDIKGECDSEKLASLLPAGCKLWTEVSVPEVLTIPDVKPDIYQIVSINSRVEIMCQQIIETPETKKKNFAGNTLTGRKLLIHALLRQRITYISTEDCGSLHAAHYDIPISNYIVLPPTTKFTDRFKIKACIEDIYACALNKRQIFKNTTLFIKASSIENCSDAQNPCQG